MLTLMVRAPCSLMPWVLLLRDLGRGTVWLLVGFGAHCMLSTPLQREKWGCEERCSSKVMWTSKKELKNIPYVDIFRVGEQWDSQAYCTRL